MRASIFQSRPWHWQQTHSGTLFFLFITIVIVIVIGVPLRWRPVAADRSPDKTIVGFQETTCIYWWLIIIANDGHRSLLRIAHSAIALCLRPLRLRLRLRFLFVKRCLAIAVAVAVVHD